MSPCESTCPRSDGQSGQAALLLLGVLAALLVGILFFVALGQALGGRSKHQRAADLAAVSAARAMADVYPRLFEPPVIEGTPNPRHLTLAAFLELARRTAVGAARDNGVAIHPRDVRFPPGFAPTRVTVVARGRARVRVPTGGRRVSEIPVRARASAELSPGAGGVTTPAYASGGGYKGPLAYRQGKPTCCLCSAL